MLEKVGEKQAAETTIIKSFITNFRQVHGLLAADEDVTSALASLRKEMIEVDDAAYHAAKAEVTPIRYTISIK